MMETPSIKLLHSCDEWKMKNSMALVCASTNRRRIREVIEHETSEENMEYVTGEPLSIPDQIRALRRDWKEKNDNLINERLKYGFLEVVGNGEIL